jgi:hypothetical protein
MGQMKTDGMAMLGTIGEWYSDYFPIMLFIVAILTALNIVDRIGACFGIERFKFAEKMNDEAVREGKSVFQRERKRKIDELRRNGTLDDSDIEHSMQINPTSPISDLSDEEDDYDYDEPVQKGNTKIIDFKSYRKIFKINSVTVTRGVQQT